MKKGKKSKKVSKNDKSCQPGFHDATHGTTRPSKGDRTRSKFLGVNRPMGKNYHR